MKKVIALIFSLLLLTPAFSLSGSIDVKLKGAPPSWITAEMEERLLSGGTVIIDNPSNLNRVINSKIAPGSWMYGPNWCTFNFIFKHRDTDRYSIGTAGHCVYDINTTPFQPVYLVSITPDVNNNNMLLLKFIHVGDVIYRRSGGVGDDFALVSIYPENENLIDPKINVIDGPCGHYTGDLFGLSIMHYGHGFIVGTGGTPRIGIGDYPYSHSLIPSLINRHHDSIGWVGIGYVGDSGSPVRLGAAGFTIDNDNAAAVGILTHGVAIAGAAQVTYLKGTSIEKIFRMIGYDWQLVNSPGCQ